MLAFLGDIVAVAGLYADLDHFNAMASKRIKGAKTCIKMVKNSDRVATVLSDILGDVCAIISGSMGASLAYIIIGYSGAVGFTTFLIIALVGAAVSGVTVVAKAIAKKIAIKNSTKIVFGFGKFLSVFKKD
jgi:CBS domain containing-hemolysin-like protein